MPCCNSSKGAFARNLERLTPLPISFWDERLSTVAAERGHRVTLFDASHRIGGQFNIAKTIPGKEEFHETLRYFEHKLRDTGVEVRLSTTADADTLKGFDEVVLATGIVPRT